MTSLVPVRRPGSVRRTASLDLLRPEGLDGPLVVNGFCRDLLTQHDGGGQVVEHAAVTATVDGEGHLRRLATWPLVAGASRLVGRAVGTGFRTAVRASVGGAGSPLYQLLDELPVARIIGGFAVTRRRGRTRQPRPDVCIGWRTGGTALTSLHVLGSAPDPLMQVAGALTDPDDTFAWHTMSRLPVTGMRRHRVLDVLPGDPVTVWAMFRDTHVDDDGVERILHQYTLTASFTPAFDVLDVVATPHVLPFGECPSGAATAERILGAPAARLREIVSVEYWGRTTCTHLNDLLRTLADVPYLSHAAAGARPWPTDAYSTPPPRG